MWKIFIKFRGCCSYLAEVVPWSRREIMMLDVVAEIKVEDIPNS
jgi:hypothetical protein